MYISLFYLALSLSVILALLSVGICIDPVSGLTYGGVGVDLIIQEGEVIIQDGEVIIQEGI